VRSLWVIVAVVAACTYGDPATNATFKCDPSHACPNGEACVGGFCGGSAAGGSAGVFCGSGGTCAPGQLCCVDVVNAPHCINSGETCVSGITGACDGLSTCAAPSECCGMESTACGSAGCQPRVCLTGSDCDGGEPNCCFDGTFPWGRCSVVPC